MKTVALVMAGGQGRRMGAPKPLVPVSGVPLVERNLLILFGMGFDDVVVAVPEQPAVIGEFLRGRPAALARALGIQLEVFVEREPLGTIGCARHLRERADDVLVQYADNLTGIDWRQLVQAHRDSGAAMTLAAHEYPLRNDFGELVLEDDDRVVDYREKPVRTVVISSGAYVLGAAALEAMPDGRLDAPTLVRQLLADGRPVHAHRHRAPWIDVNRPADVQRAEALVAEHAAHFECWSTSPSLEVVGAALVSDRGVLLERRPDDAALYPGRWDTPGGKIEPGETPGDAIRRELKEELGLERDLEPVARFDDVDIGTGRIVRHHVFTARVKVAEVAAREGQRLDWHATISRAEHDPVVVRSVLAAERALVD